MGARGRKWDKVAARADADRQEDRADTYLLLLSADGGLAARLCRVPRVIKCDRRGVAAAAACGVVYGRM